MQQMKRIPFFTVIFNSIKYELVDLGICEKNKEMASHNFRHQHFCVSS